MTALAVAPVERRPDRRLRELWGSTRTFEEIGACMSMSVRSVKRRAEELGLGEREWSAPQSHDAGTWSPELTARIHQLYVVEGKSGSQVAALCPGMSKNAICTGANRRGWANGRLPTPSQGFRGLKPFSGSTMSEAVRRV